MFIRCTAPPQLQIERIAREPTAGVMKDVLKLGGLQEPAFDFVANNPGPIRFHRQQQLHMDYGFMALFDYA
jgi:FtsP/CotA-like multicopper oxidase with cupredoxin domain